MKRLLIFILVLGFSSSASAVLTGELTVDGSSVGPDIIIDPGVVNTIQIGVKSDDSASWLGYCIIEEGGSGELSNPWKQTTVGPGYAGDNSYITSYSEAGWGSGYEMQADWLSEPPQAGIQFTMDLDISTINLGDSFRISLWDDAVGYEPGMEVDYLSLTVIPEPATISLLALGGLAVLKRRGR